MVWVNILGLKHSIGLMNVLIKIGKQPFLEETQVSYGCCLISGTRTLCNSAVMCQSKAAALCIFERRPLTI